MLGLRSKNVELKADLWQKIGGMEGNPASARSAEASRLHWTFTSGPILLMFRPFYITQQSLLHSISPFVITSSFIHVKGSSKKSKTSLQALCIQGLSAIKSRLHCEHHKLQAPAVSPAHWPHSLHSIITPGMQISHCKSNLTN